MFILPPCRVCWASQRTSEVWRRARTSMVEETKHWAAPTESRETSWWTDQRMDGCLKDDYPWCLIYDILFDTLPLSGPALCTHMHTHTHTYTYTLVWLGKTKGPILVHFHELRMHTNSSASLSVVVAEQFLDQLVKPLVRMLSTLDVLQTHATLFSPKRHSCQDGKAPVTAVNSSRKMMSCM